jgi:RNA polymerase sigma factor (sigma-70 family)
LVFSDAELARAAKESGDGVSLGILLERHRAPLYVLALGFLGYTSEAQDAVQDTFLTALRTIERLREPEAVGWWLRGILRNVCLRRLRERHKHNYFEHPEGGEFESALLESSVEEAIDRLAMREWVWSALGRLPEELQLTVALRYFGSHQASYEEISAVLGVPMGTVKSRLNTVKLKLAEALLEAAGLEHDESRRLSEARASFFESAYQQYNRQDGYDILASAFSEDLVMSISTGKVFSCGYEFLVEDCEKDLEVGVKMHPREVICSKDVAVIECDLRSPPEDPEHCPPSMSQVALYGEEKIQRLHWHMPPRAVKESYREAEWEKRD